MKRAVYKKITIEKGIEVSALVELCGYALTAKGKEWLNGLLQDLFADLHREEKNKTTLYEIEEKIAYTETPDAYDILLKLGLDSGLKKVLANKDDDYKALAKQIIQIKRSLAPTLVTCEKELLPYLPEQAFLLEQMMLEDVYKSNYSDHTLIIPKFPFFGEMLLPQYQKK